MSEDIQDSQIETVEDPPVLVIEGAVDNGAILQVAFPFYTGSAGVRDCGAGRVEFAFFRPTPLRPWRSPTAEGVIGGNPYGVISSKISDMTKAMIVVTAQAI